MRLCLAAVLAVSLCAPAIADPALDALVAGYPDHLAGYDANDLIFKDGTRLPISDGRSGKSYDQMLDAPDIDDQFAIPYPLGSFRGAPALNEDPGRIRNGAFFRKIYGDCRRGEVARHLKPVTWLSRRGGTVTATRANGVAGKLAEVSAELETLPAEMIKYLVPSAGTYNCRPIAGTQRLSAHGYGVAIDLNATFGDYWRWVKGNKRVWKNRIPLAIVAIFEKHGFIWGGKWYHFDTLHFEYRPEIIALARQGWPRK